jgi:hypothetical protein
MKSAYNLLPTGAAEKKEIATKLEEAEHALELSNAKLAKELGYHLCQCQFPPKIMLWDNSLRAYICQNAGCRRVIAAPKPVRVSRPPRRERV